MDPRKIVCLFTLRPFLCQLQPDFHLLIDIASGKLGYSRTFDPVWSAYQSKFSTKSASVYLAWFYQKLHFSSTYIGLLNISAFASFLFFKIKNLCRVSTALTAWSLFSSDELFGVNFSDALNRTSSCKSAKSRPMISSESILSASQVGNMVDSFIFSIKTLKKAWGELWFIMGIPWNPYLEDHPSGCKWLVTPIYKPFSPFGRGITLHRELTNHGY